MVVWLCFDAHREDGQVWAVRAGNKWLRVAQVQANVELRTCYRGRTSRQPKAYLVGQAARVTGDSRCLTIQ